MMTDTLPFTVALGAFIASSAMTMIALGAERYGQAKAGLGLMILTGIIAGNLAAGVCGV